MIYPFYMCNGNGFSLIEFDDNSAIITETRHVDNGLTMRKYCCKANMLYGLFCNIAGEFSVKSYKIEEKNICETGSFDLGNIDARNIELFFDHKCVMIPCGASGFDLAVLIDSEGNVTDIIQKFPHSAENSDNFESCAVCCRMTTNSYRIASLDKNDGVIAVSNFYSTGDSYLMRECSRITLGSDKGITDIIFTDCDIAYVLAQNSNEIIAVDFHSGSGSLWPLKSYSIPCYVNSEYQILHRNNQLFVIDKAGFIYCLNICGDGGLKFAFKFDLNGFKPNEVMLTHDEKYLILTGTESVQIQIYRFDGDNVLTKIV